MKTGREVLLQALSLLGYTNHLGEIDSAQHAETMKRGTSAVMQIYRDLKSMESPSDVTEYTDMGADLPLSYRAVNDIMPNGVAMLLAQGDGNADGFAFFSAAYNGKRKAVERPVKKIVDVIPRGGY